MKSWYNCIMYPLISNFIGFICDFYDFLNGSHLKQFYLNVNKQQSECYVIMIIQILLFDLLIILFVCAKYRKNKEILVLFRERAAFLKVAVESLLEKTNTFYRISSCS